MADETRNEAELTGNVLTERVTQGESALALQGAGGEEGALTTFTEAEMQQGIAAALAEAAREVGELEAKKAKFAAEKMAFDKTKAEWDVRLAAAQAVIFESKVSEVATRFHVDPARLREMVGLLGLSGIDKVEMFAEMMPKIDSLGRPDSGAGVGSVDLSRLTPEEMFELGLREERRKRGRP